MIQESIHEIEPGKSRQRDPPIIKGQMSQESDGGLQHVSNIKGAERIKRRRENEGSENASQN